MADIYKWIRPILMRLPAEWAHSLVLRAIRLGFVPAVQDADDAVLQAQVWGIDFDNPLGLAAGFDKDAEVFTQMSKLGFGFVEAGTVTPKPQSGNPRPRIFRDVQNKAVINRMGFPSKGLDYFQKQLAKGKTRAGILGINIGKNKTTENASADYVTLVKALSGSADYLVVNLSSPNTPGLRDLQQGTALRRLLADITVARTYDGPPLVLKISPDIDEAQKQDIAAVALEGAIDGLIIANSTLSRSQGLDKKFVQETGGLSGPPVRDLTTRVIRDMYRLTKGRVPIIGLGGISTADDAYEKIRAGASLLQIYTVLVFEGPAVIAQIKQGLIKRLKNDGFTTMMQAVGADVAIDEDDKVSNADIERQA